MISNHIFKLNTQTSFELIECKNKKQVIVFRTKKNKNKKTPWMTAQSQHPFDHNKHLK